MRRLRALLAQEAARLNENQQGLADVDQTLMTQRTHLSNAREERDFYLREVQNLGQYPQYLGARAVSEEPPEEGQNFNYHDPQNAAFYNNAYREVHGNDGYRQRFGDE